MTRSNLFTTAVVIFSLLFFSSCLDNQISDASEETVFLKVQDEINSTSQADLAIQNAEESIAAFLSSSSSNVKRVQKAFSGPEITLISKDKEFPRFYKINFGDKYEDIHGNIFRGVIFKIQSSYKENEFVFGNLIIDYPIYEKYKELFQKGDNKFYINDKLVEGYKRVDALEEGVLKFVSEIIIDKSSKQETFRYSESQRVLTDDNKTKDIYTDDSFAFTGYSKGNIFVNGRIVDYTYEIQEALKTVADWRYFVSGVTEVRIGKSTQTRYYGDGEKDDVAVQVTNGVKKEIVISWDKK